jgi:hypothetical protein
MPRFDHGARHLSDQAETPLWMPRFISSCRPGLPAGVVSRQLQLRVLNGFGWAPVEFVSALAGAAAPTTAPRTIAVPTSILVITWRYFAIDIANSPLAVQRLKATYACPNGNARPAPALATIGGSSNKHRSCHAIPVTRAPTSSSAVFKANVPINWTMHLARARRPTAPAGSLTLVDGMVVVFMDPDSR